MTLNGLSRVVTENAAALTRILDENSLPHPTFDVDAPGQYAAIAELQGARMALLDAATKLAQLALGPEDFTVWNCFLVSAIY